MSIYFSVVLSHTSESTKRNVIYEKLSHNVEKKTIDTIKKTRTLIKKVGIESEYWISKKKKQRERR